MLSADLEPAGTLLVVSDPALSGHLSAYVQHKQSIGWRVDLFDTDLTGTDPEVIRGFIRQRYAMPSTRPDAVLLVGDTDTVGHFTGSGGGLAATDLYFGCMDAGDDWLPELPVGRLSATSPEQLRTIVEKTVDYALAFEEDWTRRAAFLAGLDHDSLTEGTHDEMIEQYVEPLGFDVARLYRESLGATRDDVVDALADGQGLVVFSGHGSPTGWLDGPPFESAGLYDLPQARAAPLVLSFACDTGSYSAPQCLSEAWLRAPAGGVAAFASSEDTYWNEDDALQRHVFDALFDPDPGPLPTLGSAILQAKEAYLDQFGPGGRTRRYFEMYNLMGDPTVSLALPPRLLTDTLDAAMIGEDYHAPLAVSGVGPAVTWRLVDGELPEGITLGDDGVLRGLAETPGVARFHVRASDAVGRSVEGELTLAATRRLVLHPGDAARIEPGTQQVVQYPAEGGEGPHLWTAGDRIAYQAVEEIEPAELEAEPMGWHGDEGVWELRLPWHVSFGGVDYDRLYVSSNGFVEFLPPDPHEGSLVDAFPCRPRIAAAQADLTTLGEDDDIHVGFTDRRVVIRWVARSVWRDVPVRAQIVLGRDASVETHFLASAWLPGAAIGVSAGNGSDPAWSPASGEVVVGAHATRYEPTGRAPAGMWLDRTTGLLVGSADLPGVYRFDVRVDDLGPAGQSVSRDTTLAVAPPGDANCDGVVDATDLGILAAHWGRHVHADDVVSGDLDGDGTVDVGDLARLAAHYGQAYAPPPVDLDTPLAWSRLLSDPEPGKMPPPATVRDPVPIARALPLGQALATRADTPPSIHADRSTDATHAGAGRPPAVALPGLAPIGTTLACIRAGAAFPEAALTRGTATATVLSPSEPPAAPVWRGLGAPRPVRHEPALAALDAQAAPPRPGAPSALPADGHARPTDERPGEPDDLLAELCPRPGTRPVDGLTGSRGG
jgi:hypothetical protein